MRSNIFSPHDKIDYFTAPHQSHLRYGIIPEPLARRSRSFNSASF